MERRTILIKIWTPPHSHTHNPKTLPPQPPSHFGLSENGGGVDLDGEEDGSNLKSRTPFFLQDVEADSAKLVYVWVVDPCYEPDL